MDRSYRQPFDQTSYLYQAAPTGENGAPLPKIGTDLSFDPSSYETFDARNTPAYHIPVVEVELSTDSTQKTQNVQTWLDGYKLNSIANNPSSFQLPVSRTYAAPTRVVPNVTSVKQLSPWVVVLQLASPDACLTKLAVRVQCGLQTSATSFQATYRVPLNDAALPLANGAHALVSLVLPCLLTK